MKKVLSVLFLATVVSTGFLSADVGFGLKGGVGLSSYTGSDWKDSISGVDNKIGYSYSLGAFIDLSITERIIIELDCLYSSFTGGMTSGGDWVEWRESLVEVPVYLKYKIPSGKGGIVLMGGPDFFYTFGDINYKRSDDYSSSHAASDDYDNLFRVGLAAGLGYEMEHFRMAFLYKRALTMVYDDYELYNQNVALEIGYKF